ncbi:hypothetical protein [Actinophytocola glycyrrhizae]|uniref:Uncharacterized protein n=1 Tax=Actinophytocola glycyrrhizae TaxID=2044873 RepID=A0ABV9S6J0_9PSEU
MITQAAVAGHLQPRTSEAADNHIRGALDDLYGRIRAGAPNARVAVVGYPRLFHGEERNFGARISRSEQTALNADGHTAGYVAMVANSLGAAPHRSEPLRGPGHWCGCRSASAPDGRYFRNSPKWVFVTPSGIFETYFL